MRFAAALSEHPIATHAVGEAIGQVLDQLGDRPDAAVLFVTSPFAGALEDIAATVRTVLGPGALVGCTASGVLCGPREVESGPAVALFAMAGAMAAPRAVAIDDVGWHTFADGSTVIVLADPFTTSTSALAEAANRTRPDLAVLGGLASAGTGLGGNRLVTDDLVRTGGAVALELPPEVVVEALVSQGADPVGPPLVVTGASGRVVEEIAGQAALDRLMAIAEEAPVEVRNRMARALRVGVVLDEHREEFDRTDFLVRDVLGADRARRAIALDAEVEVGSTIQFHVQDRTSADQDLRDLLAAAPGDAALAFVGTTRGIDLFGAPHHDAAILDEHLGHGPLVGMFSAGEVGPVCGRAYLHAGSLTAALFSR